MTRQERLEFFQQLRLKLDEIDDLMDSYGGKEEFLSMYCFGAFVPGDEDLDTNDRYEFMCGMHMAAIDEYELMTDTVEDTFTNYLQDESDRGDSSSIDYWLN